MDKVQKDQPPCRETSFEYVRDGFLFDRQSQGVSKRTLRIYSQELGYFKKFLDGQGILTIEGVSAQVIRQYLNELSTHRNPGGCHIAYRVLKTCTYWWEQELDGDYTSPMRKVKSPRVVPAVKITFVLFPTICLLLYNLYWRHLEPGIGSDRHIKL